MLLDEQIERDAQESGPEPDDYSFASRLTDVLAASFAAPLTELLGAFNCIKHGDFWGTRDARFLIPLCNEWPGGAILGVLQRNGIDVYEYGATFERQFVVVDRNDYWRVIAAFDANGVPYQAEDIRA